MPLQSLLKDANFVYGANRSAAATTDVDSVVVDMSSYNSLLAIMKTDDATSGTVLEIQVFGNTANSTSSPTPVQITTSTATYTSASTTDADNKLLIADVPRWNPTYQYAFVRIKRGTQNCVVDGSIIVQYNPRTVPVTQGSTVIASGVVAAAG